MNHEDKYSITTQRLPTQLHAIKLGNKGVCLPLKEEEGQVGVPAQHEHDSPSLTNSDRFSLV